MVVTDVFTMNFDEDLIIIPCNNAPPEEPTLSISFYILTWTHMDQKAMPQCFLAVNLVQARYKIQ